MTPDDLHPEDDRREARRPTLWAKVGVVLLGLSVLLWVPLPAVPFLSLSGGHKAALGGGLLLGAEVAFWLGAALAGPEAARRARSWIGRALRRRGEEGDRAD